MLRLSKKTDYALIALKDLARRARANDIEFILMQRKPGGPARKGHRRARARSPGATTFRWS